MHDPETTAFVLSNPTHSSLQLILEQYQHAKELDRRFGAAHPLWSFYQALARSLTSSDPVQRRQPYLDVTWSLGRGSWASVPWTACLDRRDTTTTRRSVYVVYLFREDMSGVYLTLNQGVTTYTQELGHREGRAQLRARAEQLRGERGTSLLGAAGFSLDGAIDLRTKADLGRDYEAGTIISKLYERDAVPLDEALEVDLERVLQAYDAYLQKAGMTPATSVEAPGQTSGTSPSRVPTPLQVDRTQRSIFVSHSHHDNVWSGAFVRELQSLGLDVWYDEQGLSAGTAWVATVQQQLEARELFLLIMTPAAWSSDWVQEELQLALINRRHIIPIMHQPTEVSGLILTRQWIDVIGLDPVEAAARVMARLDSSS